jgi:hypothetical protein
MAMGWLDWLRKIPAPVIDHPVFGRVRVAHRPASGLWLWETLDFVQTPRGPADVGFDAGEAGPTVEHQHQWQYILKHLDELTRAAAGMIGSELTDFLEKPFPANPWAELKWEGARLTGERVPDGKFEISYASSSWPDAMITVYFEGGNPTLVQIDD